MQMVADGGQVFCYIPEWYMALLIMLCLPVLYLPVVARGEPITLVLFGVVVSALVQICVYLNVKLWAYADYLITPSKGE
ncbi:MAG: hypothetical protein ACR2RB_18660 [Gammaproteobacteria bacterium]